MISKQLQGYQRRSTEWPGDSALAKPKLALSCLFLPAKDSEDVVIRRSSVEVPWSEVDCEPPVLLGQTLLAQRWAALFTRAKDSFESSPASARRWAWASCRSPTWFDF